MNGDVVIRAEGLGKKYVIGHAAERERYVALRDVMARRARGFARGTMDLLRGRAIVAGDTKEDFWALKDVSFEVKRGEILGVIGRNGAGKSTLLKILSRITEPSEGRVTIEGRVASLLEVGTGFHPELTGRENIYLNGAILGMTRSEIRKKFDEIVAFAEVEQFLDTPVKRYSSGMYVRLAFAVAAHLEAEILIVDEVLAVGDVEFQKKCLGRMGTIASREGRTVLFVSHNMSAVSSLCGSAIWLKDGMVAGSDDAKKLVGEYLGASTATNVLTRITKRNIGEDLRIERVDLLVDNIPSQHVIAGQACTFRVYYRVLCDRPIELFSCSIMLFSEGQKLVNLWTNYHKDFTHAPEGLPKEGFIDCHIGKWPFRNQTIRVDIFSHTNHVTQDWLEEVLIFHSHDGDFYRSGIITNPDQGIFFLDHSWSVGECR